jgi:hypothetical protein
MVSETISTKKTVSTKKVTVKPKKVTKKPTVTKKPKIVKKKKKNIIAQFKKPAKKLNISVDKKERILIKKAIKKYKLNLLRNRPIEFQLRNLNSNQTLSFYRKK